MKTASLTTGIVGIAALILVNGGQIMISAGSTEPEPAFDAPAAEIARFFESLDPTSYEIGAYLSLIGFVAFLWFLGGLWAILRRAEGEPAWRSMIALGSGLVFLAGWMGTGWEVAVFRFDEGLDPQLARFAFDMGNLGFASLWVALGSFLLASGWVILESRVFSRWLGWVAIAAGIGLIVARAVWTTPVWFFPYALFWLWVIAVCILLIRGRASRPPRDRPEEPKPAAHDGTRG